MTEFNPTDPIIAAFDKVMTAYNEEYTSATSAKELEAIDKKYEKLIEDAEKEMEAAYEDLFKKEDEELQAEQEASLKELTDLEKADEEKQKKEDKEKEKQDKMAKAMEMEDNQKKTGAGLLTKTEVKKMKEKELVRFGKSLGLEISTKDKKKETQAKVLDHLGL